MIYLGSPPKAQVPPHNNTSGPLCLKAFAGNADSLCMLMPIDITYGPPLPPLI